MQKACRLVRLYHSDGKLRAVSIFVFLVVLMEPINWSEGVSTATGSEGLMSLCYDRPHYSLPASLWDPINRRKQKLRQLQKPFDCPPSSNDNQIPRIHGRHPFQINRGLWLLCIQTWPQNYGALPQIQTNLWSLNTSKILCERGVGKKPTQVHSESISETIDN